MTSSLIGVVLGRTLRVVCTGAAISYFLSTEIEAREVSTAAELREDGSDWLRADRQAWHSQSTKLNPEELDAWLSSTNNTFVTAAIENTRVGREGEYQTVQQRQNYYDVIDFILEHRSPANFDTSGIRFFHATTAVTSQLEVGYIGSIGASFIAETSDVPLLSALSEYFGINDDSLAFLDSVNRALFEKNMSVLHDLMFEWDSLHDPRATTSLSGLTAFDFDLAMVEVEQATVEQFIRSRGIPEQTLEDVNRILETASWLPLSTVSMTEDWVSSAGYEEENFSDFGWRVAVGRALVFKFHSRSRQSYQDYMSAHPPLLSAGDQSGGGDAETMDFVGGSLDVAGLLGPWIDPTLVRPEAAFASTGMLHPGWIYTNTLDRHAAAEDPSRLNAQFLAMLNEAQRQLSFQIELVSEWRSVGRNEIAADIDLANLSDGQKSELVRALVRASPLVGNGALRLGAQPGTGGLRVAIHPEFSANMPLGSNASFNFIDDHLNPSPQWFHDGISQPVQRGQDLMIFPVQQNGPPSPPSLQVPVLGVMLDLMLIQEANREDANQEEPPRREPQEPWPARDRETYLPWDHDRSTVERDPEGEDNDGRNVPAIPLTAGDDEDQVRTIPLRAGEEDPVEINGPN